MKFIKSDDIAVIDDFRKKLYTRFVGPLDAMWELLHIPSSASYLIENETVTIGHCCIDEEGQLLQMFLQNEYKHLMNNAIEELIEVKLITGARLSSIEPISFNACLVHSKSTIENTSCFHYSGSPSANQPLLNIELVSEEDIPAIKDFLLSQLGFDDNFGYTENLVSRKEIYQIRESNIILATSECRLSDTQPDFADLGVIVNKSYQGKGMATQILRQQAKRVVEMNRRPICSTTPDNIASKKAIERAGFYRAHIIFDMDFTN